MAVISSLQFVVVVCFAFCVFDLREKCATRTQQPSCSARLPVSCRRAFIIFATRCLRRKSEQQWLGCAICCSSAANCNCSARASVTCDSFKVRKMQNTNRKMQASLTFAEANVKKSSQIVCQKAASFDLCAAQAAFRRSEHRNICKLKLICMCLRLRR